MELGKDVDLVVEFQSKSDTAQTVKALVTCAVIFYTGVLSNRFKSEAVEITVPPNKSESRRAPGARLDEIRSESSRRPTGLQPSAWW